SAGAWSTKTGYPRLGGTSPGGAQQDGRARPPACATTPTSAAAAREGPRRPPPPAPPARSYASPAGAPRRPPPRAPSRSRLRHRRIVARPPERQAEQRTRRGADDEAEDGRAERKADVGPSIAFGEEDDERLPDRARLRPKEGIEPAGARRYLPAADHGDQDE